MSTLLAMQTTVTARGDLSVCLSFRHSSACFVETNEDRPTIVQSTPAGTTSF